MLRDVLLGVATVAALVAFVAALLTAHLSGNSMENGLRNGDLLLVDKVAVHFQAPHRGDVVLAQEPNGVTVVKRVIGVPGDVLEIDGPLLSSNSTLATPVVLIKPGGQGDWQRLEEPYLTLPWNRPGFCCDETGRAVTAGPEPVTVGPGEFFLLGDNRNVSEDSRAFGLVPRARILGRVLAVYWPVPSAALLSAHPTLAPA